MQNRAAGNHVPGVRMNSDLEHIARSTRSRRLLLFKNADAALLSDRRGVDAVYSLRMPKNAFDGAVADQVGLGFGDPSVVGDVDALKASFRELRQERAQPVGKCDVWRQL